MPAWTVQHCGEQARHCESDCKTDDEIAHGSPLSFEQTANHCLEILGSISAPTRRCLSKIAHSERIELVGDDRFLMLWTAPPPAVRYPAKFPTCPPCWIKAERR